MVAMSDPIRKSGISILGDVPWGTHLCYFYQTKQDLIDILVPYFRTGLENNEFCMWVISEPLTVEEARAELQKAVRELDQYNKKGQIELLHFSQWYTRTGKFDPDKVLRGCLDKERQARKKGFEGLRISGSSIWTEHEGWKSFSDYEATVNNGIHNYHMLAICSYSLDKCDPQEIMDVFSTHQFALVGRDGKWAIIESTERKWAEHKLHESEERYRSLVEAAPDVIYTVSAEDGSLTSLNPAFETLTGWSRAEWLGKPFLGIVHPDDSPVAVETFQKASRGETQPPYELRVLTKSGKYLVGEFTSTPHVKDSKVVGELGIARDITERKRVEEALRESEERFRSLVENATVGIYRTTPDGHILMANPALVRMLGFDSFEELAARNLECEGFESSYPRSVFRERIEREAQVIGLEVTWIRRDGSVILVRESARAVRADDGRVLHYDGTVEDITTRRGAEEALRRLSGRLLRLQDEERRHIARQLHETAAQGLAGLAVNLNIVKSSAADLSPRASACLSESLELAEQCSREIRTLSYLLHPPLVDEAGLAPALRWYTAGFAQRSGVEVHVDVSPEFGRLPSEFELTLYRIVQEALTNIHLHSGSKTARICLARRPNEIVLTVADEGRGFPSAALGIAGAESADIGVGIPGMQERARQLGGSLHIQSGSQGTTLTAILPLGQVTNGQTTLPFGG
jgi:PAS domain S-box-containing protein